VPDTPYEMFPMELVDIGSEMTKQPNAKVSA